MNIDWTAIEGYREDMTAEEKLTLLETHEPAAPAAEPAPEPEKAPAPAAPQKGFVTKAQFDKISSELAAAKKQLRSKMTEEEQREADRTASELAMKEELDTLRKEKMLSTYKAAYLGLGCEEKLADEASTAMADGDMDAVFSAMKKHIANMEKELRAKILKETPVPPAGDNPDEKKRKTAALRANFGLPV